MNSTRSENVKTHYCHSDYQVSLLFMLLHIAKDTLDTSCTK